LASRLPESTHPEASISSVAWMAVAPARVNLIGEHTDYTGGFVLPMAIPFSTTATITVANDGMYHFKSSMFGEERTMDPRDRSERIGHCIDYVVGVLRQFQELGIEPAPFILELHGDVPLGAGLTSSASVEIAAAVRAEAVPSLAFAGRATNQREARNSGISNLKDVSLARLFSQQMPVLLQATERMLLIATCDDVVAFKASRSFTGQHRTTTSRKLRIDYKGLTKGGHLLSKQIRVSWLNH
jgi:galactokinase